MIECSKSVAVSAPAVVLIEAGLVANYHKDARRRSEVCNELYGEALRILVELLKAKVAVGVWGPESAFIVGTIADELLVSLRNASPLFTQTTLVGQVELPGNESLQIARWREALVHLGEHSANVVVLGKRPSSLLRSLDGGAGRVILVSANEKESKFGLRTLKGVRRLKAIPDLMNRVQWVSSLSAIITEG